MTTRRHLPLALLAGGALAAALAASWAQQPAGQSEPTPPVLDRTGSTSPAPTVAVEREGCVTPSCHPGVKNQRHLHGPVQVNACDACHRLADPAKHGFEAVAEGRGACGLCHVTDASIHPFPHEPFAKGDCLACHDPHGSSDPRFLRGERYADACLSCHKDMTGAHDRVHGPASVGACGACHQPHGAALPKLLSAEGRDLCLTCHIRTQLEIESRPVVHPPMEGDCAVCHDPHATDNPAILLTDPVTLCTECHQDIANAINTASTQHAAVTTKRSCLNCHSAHASEHASLLKDDIKTLCFECHNQPIKLDDGSTLVNMKQVIESGKSLHGAITQRSCAECHQIHGGGHQRLLASEYPSTLYYPFSESAYALCFTCHDKELVQLEQTDSATGFRNGDLNLHYVHVHRDQKGRSCRLCHDTHAASRDKHIRSEVPYGPAGWKLPIRYVSLPDGGRCAAGCHASFEYNRVRPVTYPPAEPGTWKGEDLIPGARSEPPPTKPRS